jgi:hypothetical protein
MRQPPDTHAHPLVRARGDARAGDAPPSSPVPARAARCVRGRNRECAHMSQRPCPSAPLTLSALRGALSGALPEGPRGGILSVSVLARLGRADPSSGCPGRAGPRLPPAGGRIRLRAQTGC